MGHNTSSTARLFLAAVPDADTALRIYRLAAALKHAHKFVGKIIEPDRLHISLFFLGGSPNPIARMACEAAAEVRAPPFEILFDRTVSLRGRPGNRPFVLLGDKGLDRLRSLRRTLGVAMGRKGFGYSAKKDFTPHVTLPYAERQDHRRPPLHLPVITCFCLVMH